MSDELLKSLNIEPEMDKQDEIRRKKQEVYEDKVEAQHDDLMRRKHDTKINDDIDLTTMPEDKVRAVVQETDEYLDLAKNAKIFINNDFKGFVPYFARNVILVTAPTGNGKSTTCANLAYHALMNGQRPLIITNEEVTGDVYNRITCLIKGWAYVDHTSFTPEQRKVFKETTPMLSKRITVVDDNFSGVPGQTTTVEGIEAVFESLIKKKAHYDVIIFDYYQNVTTSNKSPAWNEWKCQERVAKYLDSFKQRYNAPTIVLAQLQDESDTKTFKERIEGRKIILNTATCAIEMKAEREHMRTAWTFKKSRFSEGVGETVYTGFDRGKYVLYTPAFSNQAELSRAAKAQAGLLGGIFGKAGLKGEAI